MWLRTLTLNNHCIRINLPGVAVRELGWKPGDMVRVTAPSKNTMVFERVELETIGDATLKLLEKQNDIEYGGEN